MFPECRSKKRPQTTAVNEPRIRSLAPYIIRFGIIRIKISIRPSTLNVNRIHKKIMNNFFLNKLKKKRILNKNIKI